MRPGGRSARVRGAVLAAVIDELVDVGYGGLSVESVATRAGVHKTTVYRRWASRESLVAEALLAQASQRVPMPDTGSVRADLRQLTRAVVANITSPPGEGVLRTLVSQAAQVPEIIQVGQRFWHARFALAGEVVQRGIARGELPPGTDPDLLIEALIGPLYLRLLVTGRTLDGEYADRIVDLVLDSSVGHTTPRTY